MCDDCFCDNFPWLKLATEKEQEHYKFTDFFIYLFFALNVAGKLQGNMSCGVYLDIWAIYLCVCLWGRENFPALLFLCSLPQSAADGLCHMAYKDRLTMNQSLSLIETLASWCQTSDQNLDALIINTGKICLPVLLRLP